MGTVFRKTVTRPMPAGAELFTKNGETKVRWKVKGKTKTARTTTGRDGTLRIVEETGTFLAKYRDGEGIVREVPTGARTRDGALTILRDLETHAEKVRCRILTPTESNVADAQRRPIADHFAAYRDHQIAKGLSKVRIANTQRRLAALANECGFGRLSDLDANSFERWLAVRTAAGMSPGNRNEYRQELVGFGNWCVKSRRILSNPFVHVPKADAKANPSRQRRSMTEAELRQLLFVASRRPLAEYGRLSVAADPVDGEGPAKRSNWTYAPLTAGDLDAACERARDRLRNNPAFVAELERRGRERALIYKALVLTGLRKGELASLTVGQLDLDASPALLVLDAASEKNREGSTLPIRADLAADLREWLQDKAAVRQDAARNAPTIRIDSQDGKPEKRNATQLRGRQGVVCQGWSTLPPTEPLFQVPTGLIRILDRDLQAAGIPKRDDRGRTLDVHALRHSFGTLLSKGGVAPRTAQAAMRHSSIDLTMNTYTDPRLLDVHAAVDALPDLPLNAGMPQQCERKTGTYDDNSVAPNVAPTSGNRGLLGSIADQVRKDGNNAKGSTGDDVNRFAVTTKKPLSSADNGWREVERKGVEPSTSALRTQRSPN